MKSMKLNPGMGSGILDRLREFTDLPAAGFVAGQSVASALSELYGDGKAVKYNDVDVFRSAFVISDLNSSEADNERRAALAARKRERVLQTCEFTTDSFEESYGQLSLVTEKRYKVTRTSRSGMLNEVHCLFETTDAQKFLRTFDMNCVQTCIDLETGLLHWTPEYAAFHTTRQLDIVTLHTPFHSLIRYFTKRRELEGTFGNDERIIEMLAAAYRISTIGSAQLLTAPAQRVFDTVSARDSAPPELNQLRWSFGQRYLQKFEQVSSEILPHFEVSTELHKGYPISTLKPRFQPGADLVMSNLSAVTHALPVLSRALREKHSKGLQERLNYLGRDVGHDSWTRSNLFAVGESFLKGNVSVAEIAAMDKVFNEHKIARALAASTLGEQWANFKKARAEARIRGDWVYGLLENKSSAEFQTENFTQMLDEHEVRLKKTLTAEALPELTYNGYAFKELTTGLELLAEGTEQHHCVAGYAQMVEGGNCRIISMQCSQTEIRHPSTRLTLEIRRQGKGWQLAQARGLQNRGATQDERVLAQRYCDFSNLVEVVGKKIALMLISAHPGTAQRIGKAWQKLKCPQISGRSLSNAIARINTKLANRFGIALYLRAQDGQTVSVHGGAYRYWSTVLKQKLSGKPEAIAELTFNQGGPFGDPTYDLPF